MDQDRVRRLRDEVSSLARSRLTIDAVCEVMAERRGKPMLLLPIPNPGTEDQPTGAWVETAAADFVLYAESASPLHRDRIIGHELGHIWHEHSSDDINIDAFANALPDLSPALILRMLQRHSSYSRHEEHDAELFSHILTDHISGPPAPASQAKTWTARLLTALQQPQRA